MSNDQKKLVKYEPRQNQIETCTEITNNPSKRSCQSEIYEEEKKQMFTYVNNFITKLAIDKENLNDSEEKKLDLRDRMNSAHEIIDQLKELIEVEKSSLLLYTGTANKCKYDNLKMKISWMEKSIDLAIARYNEIGIFLNLPTDNLYATANKQTVPFQLNFVSKTKKQEMEQQQMKFKETQLLLIDLRSPMELLNSRIIDYGIKPTYRFLGKKTSGQQLIYNYSCSLFGMYVEGNGGSKSEAKENTAAEMLRSIIKKQKTLSLTSHIKAFSEKELKTMSPQIKYKTNYVKILETACVKYDFPAPVYTVLSQTKNDFKLENYYSIQCEAMDFIAIGHSNKKLTAKQISAQNIIKLWEKMNLKTTTTNVK